jgi:predicted MFS family arabinose efflux permease
MVSYALATLHAVALTVLAYSGRLSVEWLAVLALIHGVIHAFSVPSAFGLLPRFVAPERLSSAIAVASAYTQLGIFVGPALAGWVLLHFGPTVAFASNIAGYGVFFASAARMRSPSTYRPPQPSSKRLAQDLVDGVRAISTHAGIRGLLALMLFGDSLSGAVRQMLPALADRGLNAGVEGLSTLLASAGVGATLSALWLAQGGRKRLKVGLIMSAFSGYIAGTAALLLASTLPLAALAMVARGFCFEICRTGTVSLLQTSLQDELRGRIMSAQFLMQQGANALGVAMIGAVADTWGLKAPLLLGCAAALCFWLALLRRRGRMRAAFARRAQ